MVKMAKKLKLSLMFLALLLLLALDLRSDYVYGLPFTHMIIEIILFFGCLVGFSYFADLALKQYREQGQKLTTLLQNLETQQGQISVLHSKVKSYKDEFRADVQNSFRKWGLTRAEADVAGLLLKGLSIKEISELRKSNEQTVRSQCSSLYKKSKLENRSQLSSYFLDDLI